MGRYLGVFTSDKSGPKWKAWRAMSEAEQTATAERGVAAVKAWEDAHADVIDYVGGPLGPTKRISDAGEVSDAVNQLTVFMVVRADSPEAAARLFGGHPHMSIFVCDGVEVMPVLGTEPPAPPSVVGGRLRREAPAGPHRGEFP